VPDFAGLLSIVLFGLWVYCIVDVLMSDASQVRSLNKWAWLAIVVLVLGPLLPIGGALWFMTGRPPRAYTGESLSERRERYAARAQRQPMPRRSRPAPAEQPVDEAVIRARIAERDRLLAKWQEEDRRKREQPGSADLPADSGSEGA
jgi:hypothetical protein